MPAFRVNGSTGQAPTTAFMGPIPDRFSMARAQHYVSATNSVQIDSFAPTNYVNSWTPYNTFIDTNAGTNAATVSLGATTTAPDGTSSGNAQKIVEAANTGNHAMSVNATLGSVGQNGGWTMRMAVFAKAAERTRISLTMGVNGNNVNPGGLNIGQPSGCQTIFDLAGVQIGVANTAFNFTNGPLPTPVPGSATIQSFGGGWCLCMMDMFLPHGQSAFQGMWCSFGLDSGSGTGATSISYAGDGTSGVYAWRSSILPPGAWAMSGATTFFSGFDSINEIDVNNTKAAGFKWYTNNIFPGGGFNSIFHPAVVPTPSNQISVGGSVLTLSQQNGAFLQTQLMSAASIGDSVDMGVVGNTFIPPFLWEFRASWDAINIGSSQFITWCLAQGTLGIGKYKYRGIEIDFGNQNSDYEFAGALWTWMSNGTDNNGLQGPFFTFATFAQWTGYQAWNATTNYNANINDCAGLGGVAYAATTRPPTNNINNPPPNASFWSVVPTPTTNITSYNFINFNNMNTFNTLVLPAPYNDSGWMINFMNGTPCGITPGESGFSQTITFGPLVGDPGGEGGGYIDSWTADPIILILYAGNNGSGGPAKFEYTSVVQ